MTYQELVTEIKQLPLSEQLSLLTILTRLVSAGVGHVELAESSVAPL